MTRWLPALGLALLACAARADNCNPDNPTDCKDTPPNIEAMTVGTLILTGLGLIGRKKKKKRGDAGGGSGTFVEDTQPPGGGSIR